MMFYFRNPAFLEVGRPSTPMDAAAGQRPLGIGCDRCSSGSTATRRLLLPEGRQISGTPLLEIGDLSLALEGDLNVVEAVQQAVFDI